MRNLSLYIIITSVLLSGCAFNKSYPKGWPELSVVNASVNGSCVKINNDYKTRPSNNVGYPRSLHEILLKDYVILSDRPSRLPTPDFVRISMEDDTAVIISAELNGNSIRSTKYKVSCIERAWVINDLSNSGYPINEFVFGNSGSSISLQLANDDSLIARMREHAVSLELIWITPLGGEHNDWMRYEIYQGGVGDIQ